MPIRLLRYLILLLCIPFAVAATEIDYKQIQKDLNGMGYNVGVADGIPGRNTRAGIKNFFNDAGYVTPSEVTGHEESFIRNVATFTVKPLDLMKDVITRKIKVKDLSNDQLCELHAHLDVQEGFYEIKRRKLECPSGTEKVIRYDGELLNDPIKLLRKFQKANKVKIPAFNLSETNLFSDWDKTKKNYYFMNPKFDLLLNQDAGVSYCANWMPQIISVPTNPSKNLDGTGSWANDTIRDGFVTCQESLNALYLNAFSSRETVAQQSIKQFQNIVETWVENGGANSLPFMPYHPDHNSRAGQADPNFTYVITISKLMAGVELLQSQFNWTPNEKKQYAVWAKDRVLQLLPVGGRIRILENSICDLDFKRGKMNDACMNAAPFVAQGLLRAAIAGNDQELAELSYLVFKQYSSALRTDGSQVYDSLRDCYAADYTIWASEFLHDYIYLASTAGVDLWDDRFSQEHGSPKENIEYALRVVSDPNVVNEYAQDYGYSDCKESNGQIVQDVDNYPRAAFAYYLKTFKPEKLDDIYLEDRNDIGSYTEASGINYEVDLLNKHPALKNSFKENKEDILRRRLRKSAKIELRDSDTFEILNWYTKLKSEGFRTAYEAKDTLIFSKEGSLVSSSHEDISTDGIVGWQNLTYSLQDNVFKVRGTATVLGDEQIFINVEEPLETGKATIAFGRQDKLVISWSD